MRKVVSRPAQHEERENLHDVVEPWVGVLGGGCTLSTQRAEDGLGNDSTNLTARG